MKKKNLWWIAMLQVVLVACGGDSKQVTEHEGQTVLFSSAIEGSYMRAAGGSWYAGDVIGVYMKRSGEPLRTSSVVGDNVPYDTGNGTGDFRPQAAPLTFSEDNGRVDFIAYYPYRERLDGFVYPVDVTRQEIPAAIDLLYADGLKGIAPRSNALHLSFSHQLARLVLHFKSVDGSSTSGIKATLVGVKTRADFRLTDGTLVADDTSKGSVVLRLYEGGALQADAILLPEGAVAGAMLRVDQGGKSTELPLAGLRLEKGGVCSYTVHVEKSEFRIDPEGGYAKWRETPLIVESSLQSPKLMYVVHDMPNDMKDPVSKRTLRNYSLLYDTDLKMAYWVAYPLFKAAISGAVTRTDAWNFDPKIPVAYQANLSSGFDGGKVYDRGHQLPSADRTCDTKSNESTFYFSNMTPQIGKKLNQTIWADLEDKVRSWVDGTDTLFVVTGAMPPATEPIERQKGMAVPAYYYKALARKVDGVFRTIAFKMDNKEYSDSNYMGTALSVEELEAQTGFTFFPTLDAAAKKLDRAYWK